MYRAFLNETLFFDTSAGLNELLLTSAVIHGVAGESGSFSFVVPQSNVCYGEFHRLSDYVYVYENDQLKFSGRVYSIRQVFDTQLEIECEGMLAVLNDSIIRPYTFDDTVENLVIDLIAQHNSQVDSDKQITIGTINIPDKDLTAFREYQLYETTINRINTLVGSFGGYISVTGTAGNLTFDWLESYTDDAQQEIILGSNILDITREIDSSNIITVLIPLGTLLDDEEGVTSNARLTIASVNSGLDYIEADQEYLDQYGRIVGAQIWDDVTFPENLKTKGQEYLNSVLQGKITITVTAVDLSHAGYDFESFGIGQRIKVTSAPHDINGIWFECTEQTLDLLHPAQNQLVLGSVEYGYIKTKRLSDDAKINGIINQNYRLNEALKGVNQDLTYRISEFESTINQMPEEISASVLETVTNQYNELLGTLQSSVQLLSDQYNIWFGEDGHINTWFEFNADYFQIRKENGSLYSRQDNDSYEFVDQNGNTLLELNESGLNAATANVTGQLKFLQGTLSQWAIRKGAYISSLGGVNLDDVWIG